MSAFPKGKRGFFESLWYSSHHFGCPLYFQEEKILFGKKFIFPSKLLRTSISVSLTSVRGAGGYTICPSLSFYPIVKGHEAPAFKLAWEGLEGIRGLTSPAFFETFLGQLRSVYEERKATPKDITHFDGSTILHVSGATGPC